jgi:hypothetical protein
MTDVEITATHAVNATLSDRITIVVLPTQTRQQFRDWYEKEAADTQWLNELPCLHAQLRDPVSQNGPYGDPEPDKPNEWDEPVSEGTAFGIWPNHYHRGATYEMRSIETPGGHGHQATYDSNGRLITDANCPLIGPEGSPCIAAGSADKSHPSNLVFENHRDNDVTPFVQAAQLDGNPVTGTVNLTGPLTVVGEYIQMYFKVRPTLVRSPLGRGVCGQ